MDFLQIFLLINIFLLGIAATVAVQHAYAHFLHKRYPEKDHSALQDSPLPPKLKERLIKEARENFQDALDASADSLKHDLKGVTDRINLHLEELGNDIVHKESERYRSELAHLYGHAEKDIATSVEAVNTLVTQHRQQLEALSGQTEQTISGANQDIETYKQELRAKLDTLYSQADAAITDASSEIAAHTNELKQQLSKEVATEKQQLIQQFETRMADAVTSFLVETLGHNIDLGAQTAYLTTMLDEHKDELVKGLKDET